ncbi:MAG: heme exporter protein CcmD [Acidimicrobiales bacterium]
MIAGVVNNGAAWAYVGAAWAVTAAVVGGYTVSVLRRGKALSKRVPEDKRRWM